MAGIVCLTLGTTVGQTGYGRYRVSDTGYDSRTDWIWQVSCVKFGRMRTTE
jgi:hypothetical protein